MKCYPITVFLFLRKKLYKNFHGMDQLSIFSGSSVLKFCNKRPIPSDAIIKLPTSAKN